MATPKHSELADPTLQDGELRVCRSEVDRLIGDLEAALFIVGLEIAFLEIGIQRSPAAQRTEGRSEGTQLALVDALDDEEAAADMNRAFSRPASKSEPLY